ncbi:recombinase family protein [Sphingomonas cannabina]|uniref:recombinase family protein n=1 Tax=Sphingomonas cannabina TaxID=2899123 RepID=UPI003872F64D
MRHGRKLRVENSWRGRTMTRVVIYARYSTDKQSERSAEDQARLCLERAKREGWEVVEVYSDLALSGASRNRPGLNALLARVADVDIVLSESIDRVSRDQEDIAAIYKAIRHEGARWVTLSEGNIDELHVGLGGTMAALYLKQLGEKTRRGQIGRVAAGRIPGGLSYGYDLVPAVDRHGRPDRGQRRINEEQAAVVRRIFDEYIAGVSPRAIAIQLNCEDIPGPAGGKWGASTIQGNRRRGTGILNNQLYIGRIVYNRQRFEKHPVTRKRIARLNPVEHWKIAGVPELAILDLDRWEAVQNRMRLLDHVPAHLQRRPQRLFSGLVKCGHCGGGYTVISRTMWGCSGRKNGSGCDNAATISNSELERRILGALRHKMLAPDVVSEFVREYHRVMAEDRRCRLSARSVLERRRAKAQAQLERLVDAIADGRSTFPEVSGRMRQLSVERDGLVAELAELEAEPVIAMHPGLADVYKWKLEDLAAAVRSEEPSAGEAREKIRDLIDAIIATPRKDRRGVELDLQGRLAAILALTQESRPQGAARSQLGLTLSMVAGTGFEPVTFRL